MPWPDGGTTGTGAHRAHPVHPQRVSVTGRNCDHFGIELRREPLGDLPADSRAPGHGADVPFKTVVGQFVEREPEAQSTGAALLLTEYPVGGDEPCARLAPSNRFELSVDGIEVVHGYEDEPDRAACVERARAVDLYDDEQALAWEAIDAGRVSAGSVGLGIGIGIGIERLCMAASGVKTSPSSSSRHRSDRRSPTGREPRCPCRCARSTRAASVPSSTATSHPSWREPFNSTGC
ncbi:hypothetical protein SAV31267_001950 [Streptomyces avermitilis]|uniref:Uncharacterized protein n=1 Tax=Streptomyces avermitilis TaxID=33903 RepID=A0A4D4MFJ6_STRAX|nr:hypothetical protein SAV31267_001950 [Streptomyces avermitilis]